MKNGFKKFLIIALLSLIASLSNVILAQTAEEELRMKVWRARMVAMELTQLDSMKAEHSKLFQDFQNMQQIAYELRSTVSMQQNIILEKNVQIASEQRKTNEAMKYQQVARKYKRQRNGVLAGVLTVVVVKGVIEVLKM